jgi:DNA-directed RNA polymerase subunit RPC12/RpoP
MTNHNNNQPPNEEQITLRCNKCGKPITPEEAVQTPTGYRCQDCVRKQQKIFDTSKPLDYVWGFLIAAVLSLIGGFITDRIGFFTFLLAPAIGVGIAEAVRFVIKKRRSKRLFRLVVAGVILGGLPLILVKGFLLLGNFSVFRLLDLGYQVLFLLLAVPSAYYRLSGSRRL